MNTNKKYAIRKLAVGIASVSIGMFISNIPEVAQSLGSVGGGVIQAFDNGNENTSNETIKDWKPEGNIIAQGEDGVPWELYENGYLLFKPEPGKDTLKNYNGGTNWKDNYGRYIQAIGFSGKVYAPENSNRLFSIYNPNHYPSLSSDVKYIEASKIDTSKVTNMSEMFLGLSGLTNLDVSNWDTSKVTNMSEIFREVRSLTNLDVSKWNTAKVTDMSSMFAVFDGLSHLTNLNVSNWNTSNVTNIQDMFAGTTSLTNLDIGKWDTSNITNMSGLFYKATGLTTLNIENWNTSKVTNMDLMFQGASNLTSLDLSKWDVRKLKGTVYMLKDLPKLKELNLNESFKNQIVVSNLLEYMDIHNYSDLYTDRWVKEDGSVGPFTIYEWRKAYENNPIEIMSGTWIREKASTKYTLNFDTSTTEQINSVEVEKDAQVTLPTPIVDNTGYKFLGWSKTQDGEVITDTTNIANSGETITLYAKWEKVNNITTERIPIEITTVYQGDNTLDKGQRNEEQGQIGEKEIVTTYKITPITGELTNPTTTENVITEMMPKVIKIGTKPTEVEKRTELPITEKQTDSLVRGKERIKQGRPRIEKEITEYTVNETTGDITESKRVEVVDEGTPTIKEVGTREPINKIINEDGRELTPTELVDYTMPNYDSSDGTTAEGDPIYNVRRITTTYKGDETLEKRKQVVEKDGKVDGNRVIKVGTKSTVVVETLPTSVRYEKDDSREKGQENITIQGKSGSKTTTTTYTVHPNTGEVTSHEQEPVVVEPTETVVKVAAKDKVEVVNKKDGETIKITTSYEVNPKTGEIKEVKKEELLSKKGIPEVSEEAKEFKGGVNPIDPPVVDIPEYKEPIGGAIVSPEVHEKPEFKGGVSPINPPVVEKPEAEVPKVEIPKAEEPKKEEEPKEVIKKKEKLPVTSSSSMLGMFGLVGAFGMRKKRKKDK